MICYCEVPVAFPTMALGGQITVPMLNGNEQIAIPKATQMGTRFRLRGKGMPSVDGRGRGDLYVAVHIDTPRRLTKEQRALIEKLAHTMPDQRVEPVAREQHDVGRPFFERVKDIFG